VPLDNPLCDGKAQARSAELATARFVNAVETFEDFGMLFNRHAGAVVADTHEYLSRSGVNRKRDFARWGAVFHGIVQQDIEDAAKRQTVPS
jgi:hypothetical protein